MTTAAMTTAARAERPARAGISRSDALTRAGALGLVSVATALAFGRVFSGAAFIPAVLAAALLPHAVGAAARARRWSTAHTTAITVALTTLVLTWIVAGETTAYGLPTPATADRFAQLLDGGWQVFRTGVAPVVPRRGVVLLCAIAVGVGALVADAIGRRPDVTVGALAPTLVLFVLTGTMGSGALRIPTTLGYVAAALTAIVIANSARLEQRRTWFTGRRLASDAAVVRSAAVIGGVAILASLILTPVIPGVESDALLRYRNRTGTGGPGGLGDYQTVSPLVDLRQRLGPRSDFELFRVSAAQPLYWRLVALDRFDGETWSVASEARDAAASFRNLSTRAAVRQQFNITGLGDQWVPAAFTPVNTTMANARIIPDSSTLIAPNPIGGARYEVSSRIEAAPTAAQIAATARPVPAALDRARDLPADFPAHLRREAAAITAGATTPYAKAQALESYFTDGSFTYDLNVAPNDDSEAISAFLRIRHGFCQQFAAAFAALARAVGLPTRVVVGFTPGEFDDETREYVVRGRNAHAWAEVWFAGLGWRAFEPTPAGSSPGQADSRVGPAAVPALDASAATTTTTAAVPTPGNPSGQTAGPRRTPDAEIISTTARASDDRDFTRPLALIAIPVALAITFLGYGLTRLLSRRRIRRRRRDAPEPAARAAGAWREALEDCARAGLPISAALTPNEQVRALARHGAPTDAVPPLRDLARLSTDLVFSPHPPDDGAVDRAWDAAAEVRTALGAGVGPRERATRALRRHDLPV